MRRAALIFIAALAFGQTDPFAPLLGAWEGEWKITQGTNDIAGKFRVTFSGSEGRFMNVDLTRTPLDGSRKVEKVKLDRREYKVEKLQSVSTDPPRYRWFAAGNCWNADIKSDGQMEGFFNAGPCSSMGMGMGARAVEFTAKKAN
jgi:hypothetical protein